MINGVCNESLVKVEGKEWLALIDLGSTNVNLTVSFAKELGVPIYKLNSFIEVAGMG